MRDRGLAPNDAISSKEAMGILDVCDRTLRRWRGTLVHPIKDPNDPSQRRWLYSRKEVESLARRFLTRQSGTCVATKAGALDPIPGSKVSQGFAMFHNGQTKAEVCVRLSLSLEQAELLESKFFTFNTRHPLVGNPVPSRAPQLAASQQDVPLSRGKRLVMDTSPEMLRWEKEIDEQNNRWEEDRTSECNDERHGPSSTRAP